MLSANDQLKAIVWKCEELGLSYGKLVSRFSTRELQEVYCEYECMLEKRKRDMRQSERAKSGSVLK